MREPMPHRVLQGRRILVVEDNVALAKMVTSLLRQLGAERVTHAHDGHVGSRLLSQDARVRVWEIRLAPGQRWHAHRHVLDYIEAAERGGPPE